MSLFITNNEPSEQDQLKNLAESIAKSRGLDLDVAAMRSASVKLTVKDLTELWTMDVPSSKKKTDATASSGDSEYAKFQEEQIKMLRRAGFDESTFATIIKTMWEEQKKRKPGALSTPIKKGPGRPKGSLNKPKTPGAPKKEKKEKRKYNMTKSVLNTNCGLITLKSICDALKINVSGNKDELSARIAKAFGADAEGEMNKLSSKLLAEIIEDITEESAPVSKKEQIKALKEHCNLD